MLKLLIKIGGVLLIVISFVLGWYWMALNSWLQKPLQIPEEGLVFEVSSGSNFSQVLGQLQQQGMIDKPAYLRIWIRWKKLDTNIKAGEYQLNQGILPVELLDLMVSGEVILHSMTLLEGWNYRQLLDAVRQHPHLKQDLTDLSPEAIMQAIGQADLHPEGQFLPETYHFPAATSALEFLKRANHALHKQLQAAWENRAPDLPYETPYEALIMASIIEKETGAAEERPEIAGVFIRRLRIGMRLQTDPTVIYGKGESFDGNLRRKDLREKTPYNTYVIKGLPPTPIAMPGLASIQAALNPADGKSLYFVSRGDGTHQFSATLADHNKAVRKYQLRRKKQK